MKLWATLLTLVVANAATADITICNDFQSGPELEQLAALCDDLKIENHKPGMSNKECWRRFGIMGARIYKLVKAREKYQAEMRAAERADAGAFDNALPLPPPGPTPTATPTATPTVTPTATPTAVP